MAKQLTAEDARQTLLAHVTERGVDAFVRYGPRIGWEPLQRLLGDRTLVRYPCEIVFDAAELLPGEFAHPVPKGESPEDGFMMFVHPLFERQRDRAAYAVLYQLVTVNYGEFASLDEAETFGAAALGLTRDEYYDALCAMSDQLAAPEAPTPVECCSGGGGGARCPHRADCA
jgi:hypothetical protein